MMKTLVFLLALMMLVPCFAFGGTIDQTFESYADNAAWLAAGRGGWTLAGADDFQVVNNPVVDAVNSSAKVLGVISPVGTDLGDLRFNFDNISAGTFSFDVYSPSPSGAPWNSVFWRVYNSNVSVLFHGQAYEYLNQMYLQYGNVAPYGGFEQVGAGALAGGWHRVSGNWNAAGQLNMWYDGVQFVTNKSMRDEWNTGWMTFRLVSADASSASSTYFDNIKFSTTPVPEPSTMLALGSGLVGLFSFGIRRRK